MKSVESFFLPLLQVCNHPDLFEGRAIVSAFDAPPLELAMPSLVVAALQQRACERPDLGSLGLLPASYEGCSLWEAATVEVRPRFVAVGETNIAGII